MAVSFDVAFLVQQPFFDDFGSTFEPASEAYRHSRMYFFDMCSIDFWGHAETSTVGAVDSSTGA